MKVKVCKKCKYCERVKGVTTYYPAKYHAVGVAYYYSYCNKYDLRCSAVKKCTENIVLRGSV